MTGEAQPIKLMQLRRDGVCGCGTTVLAGTRAGWDRARRRLGPGSRANIDHLAIGATGVYVIDAKRYRDADISVRRSGGVG